MEAKIEVRSGRS